MEWMLSRRCIVDSSLIRMIEQWVIRWNRDRTADDDIVACKLNVDSTISSDNRADTVPTSTRHALSAAMRCALILCCRMYTISHPIFRTTSGPFDTEPFA